MDAFRLKDAGDEKLRKGDLDGAIRQYDAALAKMPHFAGCHYMKGACLMDKRDYVRAAASFWSSALFNQKDPAPRLMTARALRFAPDLAGAALAIFDMVRPDEMDPLSLLFYAEALCEVGRHLEAQALADRFPDEPRFLSDYVRGVIEAHVGDPARGAELLAPLLTARPIPKICDPLLHCLLTLGRTEEVYRCLAVGRAAEAAGGLHYACMEAALDILIGRRADYPEALKAAPQHCFIRSAEYLARTVSGDFIHTGTTYRTLDIACAAAPADGLVLEFGVRHGRSLTRLARNMPERAVHGFDSFEGLPEDWHAEGLGAYSTHGRLPRVPENASLVVGWFADTLPGFLAAHDGPVALINVDCDLYSSTRTVLDALDARIGVGTVIVFDEYISNPNWEEDEFKAFQEWVARRGARYDYLAGSLATKQVVARISGFA